MVLSANGLNALIGFLGSIIVLRNVETELVGIVYPLVGILLMMGQFGDLGVTISFVKLATDAIRVNGKGAELEIQNTAILLKLILAIITCIGMFFLSNQISVWTFGVPDYHFEVRLIGLGVAFNIFSSFFPSLFQIHEEFSKISFFRVIPNLIKFISLLLLLFFKSMTLLKLLYAFLMVPLFSLLLGLALGNLRQIIGQFKLSKTENIKKLLNTSKWIYISMLTNGLIAQADILMLSRMVGSEEVAKFVGGTRLAGMLPIVIGSFITVLMPKVMQAKGTKELNFFVRKITFIMPVAIGIGTLAILGSKFIITSVLGAKYQGAIPVFQILIAQFVLDFYVSLICLIFYRLDKIHWFSALNFVQLLLNIGLNWIFIPEYGAIGATVSSFSLRILALMMAAFGIVKFGIFPLRETTD